MKKERLAGFPLANLQKIASSLGLINFEENSKEELIDAIIEAYGEACVEHQLENNWTILSEEKKFDIFQDSFLFSSAYKNYDIPEHYNITKISLTMVDPLMAFVCWELDDDKKNLLASEKSAKLFLRVNYRPLDSDKINYFDIPVRCSDDKWYINLPYHGTRFTIDLVIALDDVETILTTSNEIISPLRISRDIVNSSKTYHDDFLALAGVYGFYDDENGSNSQKIISFLNQGTAGGGI